jgi:uncharacterized CHY-type Zn-finger protein
MSDKADENYSEDIIFSTNRDKIIKLLLNEITLMDMCYYKTDSMTERDIIKVTLEMFENLLKIQGFVSEDLTDKEYDNMTKFVYHTIENTLTKLNSECLNQ